MKTIIHGPVTAADIADADLFAGIVPTSFLAADEMPTVVSDEIYRLSCEVIPLSDMMDYEMALKQQTMRLVTYGDALILRGENAELRVRAERLGLAIYQA